MPLYTSVDLEAVSNALGENASAGQIFRADGSGSGTMVPNLHTIANRLTVGQVGSDCDFTPTLGYGAIYSAIQAAIAGGVSTLNPWQIDIYPGVYAEPKMTIPVGLYINGSSHTRMDTVFILPVDPTDDLFVSQGGHLNGLHLFGVTTPGKWLVNCSVEGSFTTILSTAIHGCTGGVLVANGAQLVATNYSVIIGAPDINVGTALSVDGVGAVGGGKSYAAIQGFFSVVPDAIIPYYSTNPIQKAFSITNGGEGFIATGSFRIPAVDSTGSSVFVDSGGFAFLSAVEIAKSPVAFRVGSVGSGSKILTQGCNLQENTTDVKIESSTGKVFLSQSVDALTTDLVAGAELIGNVQNRDAGYQAIIGDAKYQFLSSGRQVDLGDFFADYVSTGVCEGGEVSADTGLYVDVAEGDGWCRRGSPNDDSKWVEWVDTNLLLTASATNYVYVDGDTGVVETTTGSISYGDNILLATVITDGSGIRFIHKTRNYLTAPAEQLRTYLLSTRKQALISGLICQQGTGARNIDIDAGSYYLGLDIISYAGATDATFSSFYGTNGATETASLTELDITNYDSSGTLTAMTTDYWRSDTVVLTSDGRISVIYGTEEFATEELAEAALQGNIPTFIEATVFPLARLLIKKATGITSIVDIRPQPGSSSGSGGTGGVSSHSALSDLDKPADHTWAMLVDGTRSMTGSLNMGTNTITNAGTINSVSITAHNPRHQPGGADAIATATPTGILVNATAAEGSAASLARSDHQHGIATGTPSSIGTANAAGSSTSVPRLDHVHAHGDQAGGSTHAVATTSVAGFESAADKTKLDGIQAGATATPLSSTAPVNITKATAAAGTAVEAARQDHKHDITTATAGASAVGDTALEGTATSLARSDHRHSVSAGTPVDVSTSNAAGSAATFARSDHVHAGLTRGSGDFNSFTAKTTPVSADILLIEDSEASNAKKKLTVGDLTTTIIPVYGGEYQYTVSEAESTTTSATYQTKLTLSATIVNAGVYKLTWYTELRESDGASDILCRIYYNNLLTWAEVNIEPKDTTNYYPFSGFNVLYFNPGSYTFAIQYRNETAGNTAYIRRARLEIHRVL